MVLGAGAFYALKMAVYEARRESGTTGWFELQIPATPERVQTACLVDVSAAL